MTGYTGHRISINLNRYIYILLLRFCLLKGAVELTRGMALQNSEGGGDIPHPPGGIRTHREKRLDDTHPEAEQTLVYTQGDLPHEIKRGDVLVGQKLKDAPMKFLLVESKSSRLSEYSGKTVKSFLEDLDLRKYVLILATEALADSSIIQNVDLGIPVYIHPRIPF
jgi:hypothetical protein